MKRVLLTGASGFIGRHCLGRLVERGFDVVATSSRVPEAGQPGVEWRQIDLLDRGKVTALLTEVLPSHLLHLAWYTEHGKFYGSSENFRWVEGSLALLTEFARLGGRRATVAGTCAEYDWSAGVLSESTTPLAPSSVYGVCKSALFRMFEALTGASELSGAWARVFLLFGPGQPPSTLVPSVIRSLLAGEPALCSEGRQTRDYLYVEDVADALVAILDSPVEGPINVASGEATAVRDLVLSVADRLGRRDLVELGALESVAGDPPKLVGDNRRLRDEVGWTPVVGTDAGLDRTIDWWRRAVAEAGA